MRFYIICIIILAGLASAYVAQPHNHLEHFQTNTSISVETNFKDHKGGRGGGRDPKGGGGGRGAGSAIYVPTVTWSGLTALGIIGVAVLGG
jgi:hypothetical protein